MAPVTVSLVLKVHNFFVASQTLLAGQLTQKSLALALTVKATGPAVKSYTPCPNTNLNLQLLVPEQNYFARPNSCNPFCMN